MREALHIDRALDGRLWRHSPKPLRSEHRHDELEFVLVMRGRMTFVAGAQRYDLAPGSLAWLFPAQEHQIISQSSDLSCWILVARPRAIRRLRADPHYRPLAARDPPGSWLRTLTVDDRLTLDRLLGGIHAGGDRPARLNPAISYAVCAAWDAYGAAAELPGRQVHPGVTAACTVLGRDPSRSLALVARDAGLSLSRLSHLFRAQLGTSLAAHRSRLRVERFLEIAASQPGRTALSQAMAAGFGSYPQFHRVFTRVMGVTPGAWLRAAR